ncbi:MAG: acylphosphatase [Thermodesulfobacteriaceae bacterium]|nr:acylphosphatase [Thermodesulfobacteriaceae bacterium]MCX8041251.1 acylphosphatase [Thermodesulfobacteriaceae bacterium]MDW8135501.1 acylphosphatase [Thermodesulfobacterium sp.]
MKRVHVFVSGRVQGVFFRAYTQKEAYKLGLKGWVRNLPDGRVEAIFEGEDLAVEKMIRWCHQGSPGAIVTKVEVIEEPYKGEFSTFEIRY